MQTLGPVLVLLVPLAAIAGCDPSGAIDASTGDAGDAPPLEGPLFDCVDRHHWADPRCLLP
jgi:hypothetical protein